MKKIQIALVSKETLPVFYMINELRPDEVYLVGTKETQSEMRYIKVVAKGIGVDCHELTTLPDSMQDCMKVCDSIHAHNGEDCEYCYNLTCGTKLMAFGALICAQSHKANAVYTDVSSYTDFSDFGRHDITRLLDTDTIIALQGQKVKGKEIWTSVRFEPNSRMQRNDKNEIDVLVNIGNALLFVECKSGSFTQDNIYKLGSVFRTYGSYKSKGVIVSYRKSVIKPDLLEKAKEERVALVVPNRNMSNLVVELDKVVNSLKS